MDSSNPNSEKEAMPGPRGYAYAKRWVGNSFLPSLLPLPMLFASSLHPRAVVAPSPGALVAVGKRAGVVLADDPGYNRA